MNHLNVKEACEYLKISRATLYRHKDKGLPFIKMGDRIFFEPADLDKWVKSKKVVGVKK